MNSNPTIRPIFFFALLLSVVGLIGTLTIPGVNQRATPVSLVPTKAQSLPRTTATTLTSLPIFSINSSFQRISQPGGQPVGSNIQSAESVPFIIFDLSTIPAGASITPIEPPGDNPMVYIRVPVSGSSGANCHVNTTNGGADASSASYDPTPPNFATASDATLWNWAAVAGGWPSAINSNYLPQLSGASYIDVPIHAHILQTALIGGSGFMAINLNLVPPPPPASQSCTLTIPTNTQATMNVTYSTSRVLVPFVPPGGFQPLPPVSNPNP